MSTLTEIVQHSIALVSSSTGLECPFPSETLNDDWVKFNMIGATNQITHTMLAKFIMNSILLKWY